MPQGRGRGAAAGVHCGQVQLHRLAGGGDAAQGGRQGVGGVEHDQVARAQDGRQLPGHGAAQAVGGRRDQHPDAVPGDPPRLRRADRRRPLRKHPARPARPRHSDARAAARGRRGRRAGRHGRAVGGGHAGTPAAAPRSAAGRQARRRARAGPRREAGGTRQGRGLVPAVGELGTDQPAQGRHDRLRLGPVGDVLARERGRVHRGAHVARVERVHPQQRFLRAEHRGQLVERGLAGAVPAPARVRRHGRVAGDGQHAPGRGPQRRQQQPGQRVRGDHVGLQHVAQVGGGQVGQRRQRRRAERGGVEHEQVEAVAGGVGERVPVLGVGDVAGDGDDVRPERRGRGPQGRLRPGVEHEAPPGPGQIGGERPAETLGRSGDDCGRHGSTVPPGPAGSLGRAAPAAPPLVLGPRSDPG